MTSHGGRRKTRWPTPTPHPAPRFPTLLTDPWIFAPIRTFSVSFIVHTHSDTHPLIHVIAGWEFMSLSQTAQSGCRTHSLTSTGCQLLLPGPEAPTSASGSTELGGGGGGCFFLCMNESDMRWNCGHRSYFRHHRKLIWGTETQETELWP